MAKSHKAIWDFDDCALILIDYQPEMFRATHSASPELIELNVCALARAAVSFNVPVILSTIGVEMGVNKPTIEVLRRELPGVEEIDRSSMNAWEDDNFFKAVKATGKTHLIFAGLFTEICLTYPVVEALVEGYDVAFVADAVGGESVLEHEMAVARLIQAGAVPNTTISVIAEWFRDWKSPLANQARELFKNHMTSKLKLKRTEASHFASNSPTTLGL
jgi:nicotinamidase-related amidase